MTNQITRRDFLKLAGLLPLSIAAPRFMDWPKTSGQFQDKPRNVIIVVFDALSAHDISLYGYQRDTMPNLSSLAERAIVYHNHYAGGNFTVPGTASLLTGAQPWSHRAFQANGTVQPSFVNKSIFSTFGNYYRLSYSHNPWVNAITRQFESAIDQYIPRKKYFLSNDPGRRGAASFLTRDDFLPALFGNDEDIASVSWIRTIKRKQDGYSYSLFLSHLYEYLKARELAALDKYAAYFPRGLPSDNYYEFLLEDAIDALSSLLPAVPQPFMGYFHFYPPHAPYHTHLDFYKRFFQDGWKAPSKPIDLFGKEAGPRTQANRAEYDEFILYVDREFGRFYHALESSGLLENTWLVFTSDHGELFERGIEGHRTPVLYQPLIHIPLLIFAPGRASRMDIYAHTHATDVLPTLLQVTGQPPAEWVEGQVLPPFSGHEPQPERSLYVVHAEKNEQFRPLTVGTYALIQGRYKLMAFFGYPQLTGQERVELYDLENDPEELNDLSRSQKSLADQLLAQLKAKLDEVNQPYGK
ncbi:MAG: sulfatase-like hydrolase/transferase [Anaerolineales bacterium]